jgi:hypothetical protein
MTTSTLDRTGFVLAALSVGAVQFSLFLGQSILFIPAALLWLVVAIREGRRPDAPAFFLPLIVYVTWTLVSSVASLDPMKSLVDSRQLLLFLMVPVVARFARGDRAMRTIDLVIAVGAAGALVGIVQFTMLGFDNLDHRPVGPLSHWMTYSGL